MLVQQFQRPTRVLALITSICLVYLCLTYLRRIDFATGSCNPFSEGAFYESPLGATRMLGLPPATMPKKGPVAKVAKVGVAVNALDIPVVHRAFKTHQLHNNMHGYPHYIADREVVSDLIDNDRMRRGSGAYTKPAYLLAIIIAELLKPEEERLQWLFWFDGDTAILNPSTPLETFLPPNTSAIFNDVHLIIASNWDGLNSGVFALRVHTWSASMLSGVLAYPMYEKERTMKDRFRDQSAFQFLLTHDESPLARDPLKHRNHWAKVPMRWYNSLPVNNAFYANGKWLFGANMTAAMFDNGTTDVFDDGRDGKIQPWKVMQGDMVVHFAGTKAVRDSWMTPWLDRAEALLPEWNNPNHTAKLAVEVAQYWQDYEEQMMRELDKLKAIQEEEKQRKIEQERVRLEEKKKAEERKKIEQEQKKEEQRKKEEEKKKAEEKQAAEEAARKQKQEQEAAASAAAASAAAAAPAATAAAEGSTTTTSDGEAPPASDSNNKAPDEPAADTPAADTPAADTPAADTPAPDTPAPDTPAPDTPSADSGSSEGSSS